MGEAVDGLTEVGREAWGGEQRQPGGGSSSSREQTSPLLPCVFATRFVVLSCTDCLRDGRILSSGGAGVNIIEGILLKSGASSDRGEQACGGSSTAGSCRAPERARRFAEVHEDLGQS